MRILAIAEDQPGELRVALTPEAVQKLTDDGHAVSVETGAGHGIYAGDDDYRAAGAGIAADRSEALADAELIVSVAQHGSAGLEGLDGRHTLAALLDPLWRPEATAELARSGADALSLELVPRISRAQSMDVLSSMATVAGYQAVLVAAQWLPRMFPMMMTAAGTVPPTRVVVLGAGVAGLQAIATARRLGAVVGGYDVRPAAAEQIQSLGAKAIELDIDGASGSAAREDSGGYATAQADDEQAARRRALAPHLARADLVITTAAIPGAAAPLLIDAAAVEGMQPGSLIVDLAAARGGNCALTRADEEVVHHGVVVLGPTQLESGSARTASRMFANNLLSLIGHLADDDGRLVIDPDDEITGAMLVASGGEVVHPAVKEALA